MTNEQDRKTDIARESYCTSYSFNCSRYWMIPFVQLQSWLKNNDLLLHNTVSKLENPNSSSMFVTLWNLENLKNSLIHLHWVMFLMMNYSAVIQIWRCWSDKFGRCHDVMFDWSTNLAGIDDCSKCVIYMDIETDVLCLCLLRHWLLLEY